MGFKPRLFLAIGKHLAAPNHQGTLPRVPGSPLPEAGLSESLSGVEVKGNDSATPTRPAAL